MGTGHGRRLPKNRPFGRRGFVLLTAGLVAMALLFSGFAVYSFGQGGSRGIFYAVIGGLGAISALTLAGFMSLVVARWDRIS